MVKLRRRKQHSEGTTVEVQEVRRYAQSLLPRLEFGEAETKEKVPDCSRLLGARPHVGYRDERFR
jgi:hypothetical protein